MKIAFFEIEDWMQEYCSQALKGHEVIFEKKPLTTANAASFTDVDIISPFVLSKVTREVINKFSQLKLIAARSTGFDHIDLKTAAHKNIIVTNVPRYGTSTVAEHTWALILAVTRKIFQSYERTEQANFSLEGLRGLELEGKTLGLIGLGEIGTKVALMGRAFNCKLRIFTRTKDPQFATQFDSCIFVDRIEDVFTHSDIISFHVPLTPQTCHLLNKANYQYLKRGCIVVNTARGALIQTNALIQSLQEGIVRGAGLDVLESEDAIKNERCYEAGQIPNESELTETYLNHVLIGMDNVIITPHNAFNSDESIKRLIDTNLFNITAFIAGNASSLNTVSPKL